MVWGVVWGMLWEATLAACGAAWPAVSTALGLAASLLRLLLELLLVLAAEVATAPLRLWAALGDAPPPHAGDFPAARAAAADPTEAEVAGGAAPGSGAKRPAGRPAPAADGPLGCFSGCLPDRFPGAGGERRAPGRPGAGRESLRRETTCARLAGDYLPKEREALHALLASLKESETIALNNKQLIQTIYLYGTYFYGQQFC